MKFNFQTILIVGSIVICIGAILVFSGIIKIGSSSTNQKITGSILIWGIYPTDAVQNYLDQLTVQNKDITYGYTQVNSDTFTQSLTEAISNGVGPDLVLLDSDHLFAIQNRLYKVPYTNYPERTFRDTFVDGASVFLTTDGVLAVPLAIDPLVVYYNKDLLAGQSYVTPPSTWVGLVQSLPRFFKKDARGVISQTAIGMGESDNVTHFKDILGALFLQSGSSILTKNAVTGQYEQTLTKTNTETDTDTLPAAGALRFYTNFASQTSSTYSWNRSLLSTRDMFISGRSAFYIGRASELFGIQSQNPNLSFDVMPLFQPESAVRPITYGAFTGIAVVKTTAQFAAAYTAFASLSDSTFTQHLATTLSLPPARRDLLLVTQTNPYMQVFFSAALSAFTWQDPNPAATEGVFRDMIRSVNNGRVSVEQAIVDGAQALQSAVR